MNVLRTPASRFEKLPGYPLAPHYPEVALHPSVIQGRLALLFTLGITSTRMRHPDASSGCADRGDRRMALPRVVGLHDGDICALAGPRAGRRSVQFGPRRYEFLAAVPKRRARAVPGGGFKGYRLLAELNRCSRLAPHSSPRLMTIRDKSCDRRRRRLAKTYRLMSVAGSGFEPL